MNSARRILVALAILLLPRAVFAQERAAADPSAERGTRGCSPDHLPLGETMLIDTGPTTASSCQSSAGIITQLANIGLTRLDYHVASHYHADHIWCSDLVVNRWPVQIAAYDRGTTQLPSSQVYARYAAAVSLKRRTVTVGHQIVLDAASAKPRHLPCGRGERKYGNAI
jgi:glyoxylase-like metal-dependent hydrolase (beta-lactamase superfamily II)